MVVGALDELLRVAVTVVVPLFSEIEAEASANVTVGALSLSVTVREVPVTEPARWLLATLAVTVPVRLPSSLVLSTAVMVAVSVLVVEPAAKMMVAAAPVPTV